MSSSVSDLKWSDLVEGATMRAASGEAPAFSLKSSRAVPVADHLADDPEHDSVRDISRRLADEAAAVSEAPASAR